MARAHGIAITVGLLMLAFPMGSSAQQLGGATAPSPTQPFIVTPPLPPATALEAFAAPPGSMLTVAHERIGDVDGIAVEVRDLRNGLGQHARGVVVTVPGTPAPQQAFLDEDELPGLLKGFDQLLTVTANPTDLKNFEMSYATKGELVIAVQTYRSTGIVYSVGAGRVAKTTAGPLYAGQLQQLRMLIQQAAQRLATLPER